MLAFGSGEYEDGIANNSVWEEGDWNRDGEFDSADLVEAMQSGGYEATRILDIGRIEAGDWASSVADWLTFRGRYGVAPDEDPTEARRQFESAIAQAAQADPWLRDHAPRVEWAGGQFNPASIPADHPLVETVADAFGEATGVLARIEGMTYGADMRLLVNEGRTPTVLFGPGNVRHSHRPDEFVPIDDLLAVTRTLALTALRFCGGAS